MPNSKQPKKSAANPAESLNNLTDEQVKMVVDKIRSALGPGISELADAFDLDLESTVRFMPVARRCKNRREEMGLSVKDVSTKLRIPQYRIKDIEAGSVRNISLQYILPYIDFLKIREWFDTWLKNNPGIIQEKSE